MTMNYNKYIKEYLDIIDNEVFPMCKEQKLLSKFIKNIFDNEKLIIDEEKVENIFLIRNTFLLIYSHGRNFYLFYITVYLKKMDYLDLLTCLF